MIIISLLVVEIGLRFIFSIQDLRGGYWPRGAFVPHPATGYLHSPGFDGYLYRKNAFKTHVRLNSLGLNEPDMEQQLLFDKKVLVLGDSFAFGLGVPQEKSFPQLLKPPLNRKRIGVINGAQTGFSVEQERRLGMILAKRFKPDMVLLALFPDNDIRSDYFRDYENIDVLHGELMRRDRPIKNPVTDFFRAHSYIWIMIESSIDRKSRRKKYKAFRKMSQGSPPRIVNPTLKSIGLLHNYCRDRNILFGVVMIPPKRGGSPYDGQLVSYFNSRGIPFLKIPTMSRRKHYLKKDGHWNEAGHRKAFTLILPFILDTFHTADLTQD